MGFLSIKTPNTKQEKEQAISLICNGKTVDDVAKIYNITPRTVRDWLQQARNPITPDLVKKVVNLMKEGFQKRQIVQKLLIYPVDVEQIRSKFILYRYIQGNSIHQIELENKTHHKEIEKILDNFGIKRINQEDFFAISKRLQDSNLFVNIHGSLYPFMIGNLLGDANLHFNSLNKITNVKHFFLEEFNQSLYIESERFFGYWKNVKFDYSLELTSAIKDFNLYSSILANSASSYLRMGKSVLELLFLESYLKLVYENFNYTVRLSVTLKENYIGNKPSGSYKVQVYFKTKSTIQLSKMYFEWYPERVKIIPKTFPHLTADTLCIWYLDDGSYSKLFRGKNLSTISHKLGISTESFTIEENKFLVDEIRKLTGISFSVIKSKNSKWRMVLSGKNKVKNFIDFLLTKANKGLVEAALKSFPWKFDLEHNKSWYLTTLREHHDPLIELFDLRISESRIKLPETQELINTLLEKTGSALRYQLSTKPKE